MNRDELARYKRFVKRFKLSMGQTVAPDRSTDDLKRATGTVSTHLTLPEIDWIEDNQLRQMRISRAQWALVIIRGYLKSQGAPIPEQ